MSKTALLTLGLAGGCVAPNNETASVEVLRDNRDYTSFSVYGGAEVAPGTKVFGNVDLNSPPKRADTSDLTRFNGRFRTVARLSDYFGLTGEYKDFSGDNNNVGGVGVAYLPVKGVEVRTYPLRTDGSQEAGLSFARVFEAGNVDPYVRGFFDVGKAEGRKYSVGEIQAGLKLESGWRFGLELRHSDDDRRNGTGSPGLAVGIGLDF